MPITPMKLKPTKWISINLPTKPLKNSSQCYLDQDKLADLPSFLILLQLKYRMSIGLKEEPSRESKTKEIVDHAGLSELLVKLKVPNGSPPELLEISLNNNSPHVIPKEIKDVMVDLNI